jgi:small subunit ribosomal protein S20
MANHVSALKRARQTTKKTAVNRANKTHFRSTLRALREAIHNGDSPAATAEYRKAVSVIDKSVQKGVLHKNTASRYKSRLNARVKAVGSPKPASSAKPAAKKSVKSATR